MERNDKTKTCFFNSRKNKTPCVNKGCRAWFDCNKHFNCTIIAAEEGPMTLQKIGDLFGLTRMRICQIEKNAIKKIKDVFS